MNAANRQNFANQVNALIHAALNIYQGAHASRVQPTASRFHPRNCWVAENGATIFMWSIHADGSEREIPIVKAEDLDDWAGENLPNEDLRRGKYRRRGESLDL